MEQNRNTQRIGMDYIQENERLNYSDGDIVVLDGFDSLKAAGSIEIEMVLIVVCYKGQLTVDFNGEKVTIKPKDMLICPPGVFLDDIVTTPDFKAVIWGMSYAKFQRVVCSGLEIWSLLLYASKHPVFKLLDIDMDMVEGYFAVVTNKMKTSREFYYKEIMHALMEAIFYELCVVINREMKSNHLTDEVGQSEMLFRKFIEMLTLDSCHQRSVKYYAEKMCLSPKYLSAVVRSVSGKPALEWILEYASDGIAHELRYSTKSIKEIANDFNFPTISSFGKFVKKRLGLSPREFRQHKSQ